MPTDMSLPFFRSATSRGTAEHRKLTSKWSRRARLIWSFSTNGIVTMMTGRRSMKRTPRTIGAALLGLWAATQTASADAVQWPCPVKPVESCFRHHGRLSSQNGIALTIWLVGTTRRVGLANDLTDLPASIRKYLVDHIAGSQLRFRRFRTVPDRAGHAGHSDRYA